MVRTQFITQTDDVHEQLEAHAHGEQRARERDVQHQVGHAGAPVAAQRGAGVAGVGDEEVRASQQRGHRRGACADGKRRIKQSSEQQRDRGGGARRPGARVRKLRGRAPLMNLVVWRKLASVLRKAACSAAHLTPDVTP